MIFPAVEFFSRKTVKFILDCGSRLAWGFLFGFPMDLHSSLRIQKRESWLP